MMPVDKCAICWEPESPDLPLLSVHQEQPHLFHISCLLEWMRTSETKTCALCRKSLSTTEKDVYGRLERRELLLELACKSNSVHIVKILLKDHVGVPAKERALMYACTVSKNTEIIEILLAKIHPGKIDWSELIAELCIVGAVGTFQLIMAYLQKHEEQLKSLGSTNDLILSNPKCSLDSIKFWISQAKTYSINIFSDDSLLLSVKTDDFKLFKLVVDEIGSLNEAAFIGLAIVNGFLSACQENSTSLLSLWDLIPPFCKEPCVISIALNQALQGDQFELVKVLLEFLPEKPSANELAYPFVLACQKGSLIAVNTLLSQNVSDHDTIFTGIQVCVEMGHAALLRRLLLSTEIDINRNDDSLFRRCLACYGKANSPVEKENMRQIANLLISFGANIRVDNDLALVVFSADGNLHLVGRCLDAGADPRSRNFKAFISALENFYIWPAMLFHAKGVPFTAGDCIAFKKSAEVGDMAFLRYTAELADYDVTTNDHELFNMAIQSDHLLVAQYIWDKSRTKPLMKQSIVKTVSKSRTKPLMKQSIVKTLVSEGLLGNLKYVVEKGWKITDVPGLLIDAAESNSVDMLSYLLPYSTEDEYRRAVQSTARLGFVNGFVRLMEDRRSVHHAATLEQCLFDAVTMGSSELALFLIDGKLEGNDLQPLLHEAVKGGNISLVKALVSRGAQTVHDPDLGPVMMIAIGEGFCEVVEYLHSLGIQPRKTQCLKCTCLVHAAIKSGDPEMLVLVFRISKNVVFPQDLDEDNLSEEMRQVIMEIRTGIIEV